MKKSFVTPILGVGFLLSSGVFAADYASPVTQPSANTTLSQSGASHVDNPLNAHVGGAPVATASGGQDLNRNRDLPPVVDATTGTEEGGQSGFASGTTSNDDQNDNQPARPLNSQSVQDTQSRALPASGSDVSAEQRLSRVEKQLNNIVRMNLPQQVNDIQMQLQQLSGQLQVQEHDLKLLNIQQRNFYQDLDERLRKLSGGDNDSAAKNNVKKQGGLKSGQKGDRVGRNSVQNDIELQDSNAYKAALDLVAKRQYDKAVNQLNNYITAFPNGEYVDKAHYWLGEIYFLKKSYAQSLAAFQLVVKGSPKSPRVPDALYKLALIKLVQGDERDAKQQFKEIKRRFPNSTAAQLSIIQLKRLDL